MSIVFENIGQVCASFECDGTVQVGEPCNIEKTGIIKRCGEDQPIMGKVLSIKDGIANVAVGGFVTLPYVGTPPMPGYVSLCGDDAGHVCMSSDLPPHFIVANDSVNKTITILL